MYIYLKPKVCIMSIYIYIYVFIYIYIYININIYINHKKIFRTHSYLFYSNQFKSI